MTSDAWSIASRTILAFFEHRDGMLMHKRIDQEKVEANSNKDKKIAKAKAAAEARWAKYPPSKAPSMPQAMPEQCPSPSPSPSPNGEKENTDAACPEPRCDDSSADLQEVPQKTKSAASTKFDPKTALIAEGVDEQQAADFLQIRKAKKAPLTVTALEGIKGEAEKAGMTLASAVAVCCVRGWQGFKASWIIDEQRGDQRSNNGRPSLNDIGVQKGADDDIFNQMRTTLP